MENHVYHKETDKASGLTLKIVADMGGDCESPLEHDEAVSMAIFSRRHNNPAKDKLIPKPFGQGYWNLGDMEDAQAFHKANAHATAPYAVFTVYAYEHGNIMFSPSEGGNPFSCPWDSGCAGIIALKKSDVGTPGAVSKNAKGEIVHTVGTYFEQAKQICDLYSSWCNGEVYGFVIEDEDGEHVDSCYGFLETEGADGYVLEQGRDALAYEAKRMIEAKQEAKAFQIGVEARQMEAARPDLYKESN